MTWSNKRFVNLTVNFFSDVCCFHYIILYVDIFFYISKSKFGCCAIEFRLVFKFGSYHLTELKMSHVWISFCRWRRWFLHILYWWLKEKLLRRYVAVLSFLCPGAGCLGSRGDFLCIDTFHFCKAGSGSPLWAAACNQVQWKMWFWGWWCYLQVRKIGDCIQGTHTPAFSQFAVVASPQDIQAWVFCSNLSLFFHLFCSQKLQWELSSNWQSIWISFWKHAGFRGNVHRWKSDTCKWYHWGDNWRACWENICEKQVKIAKLFFEMCLFHHALRDRTHDLRKNCKQTLS